MSLDRISAFFIYSVAVVPAWPGDLSLKDLSTLGAMLIGVLMLAISGYYKYRSWQLLRGKLYREEYDPLNR